jgi:hypothetical protein
MDAATLTVADLADRGPLRPLTPVVASFTAPTEVLAFVDLDAGSPDRGTIAAAVSESNHATSALIGVTRRRNTPGLGPLLRALTCTVASRGDRARRQVVRVADVDEEIAALNRAATASPIAVATLARLLPLTATLDVRAALVAESLAYSMLLAGPEFARWLAGRPRTPALEDPVAPVDVRRDADRLTITLNRSQKRNAYSRAMRDHLVEALTVAESDPSIALVEIRGAGPSFCSGGDLDEFGTAPDPATAHLIRLSQSVAWLLHLCAPRVHVRVHGACIGAGVELPAFAGRVSAARDAFFSLPEIEMGLIPGAGGTVSIPRRIGRWRTAYLALSGRRIDAGTALAWGLVDELEDT